MCKIGEGGSGEGIVRHTSSDDLYFHTLAYLAADMNEKLANKVVKIPMFNTADKYARIVAKEAQTLDNVLKTSSIELCVPKIYEHSANPPFVAEEFIPGKTLKKEICMGVFFLLLLTLKK